MARSKTVARALVEILDRPDDRHVVERGARLFKRGILAGESSYTNRFRTWGVRRARRETAQDQASPDTARPVQDIGGFNGEPAEVRAVVVADQHVAGLRTQQQAAVGHHLAGGDRGGDAGVDRFPVLAAVERAVGGAAQAVGEHETGLGQQAEVAAFVRASAAR